MLGFIKKDWLMFRRNLKPLIFILVIYFLMAIFANMDISFLPPFISVMVMLSTFSYDSFNNWDAYAVSIPNGRKKVVVSKYLTTIILIVASTIIVTLVSFLASYINSKSIDIKLTLFSMLAVAIVSILLEIVLYPIIFKYGIEKARIVIFAIVFVFSMGIVLIARHINLSAFSNILTVILKYWYVIVPALIIGTFLVSYFISMKIYKNKEF